MAGCPCRSWNCCRFLPRLFVLSSLFVRAPSCGATECVMSRPVTLFTGQWADLKLEELCKKAKDFGYDGLELACWGDHFEVDKALSDDTYCARKRDLLEKHDLKLFAISNHLVGQAVLDNI